MDQLLQQQHQQDGTSNLSMEQLKSALGGVLSYLKSKGVDLSQVTAAVPDAEALVTQAEAEHAGSRAAPAAADASADGGDGGGGDGSRDLLSSAMGMLGKMQGGSSAGGGTAAPVDSMTQLVAFLATKSGVQPAQIMSFLPLVAGFLQQQTGVDITSALGTTPAAAEAAATPADGSAPAAAPAAASAPAPAADASAPAPAAASAPAPAADASTPAAAAADSTPAADTTPASGNDAMGDLMNQASGFMSNFTKK